MVMDTICYCRMRSDETNLQSRRRARGIVFTRKRRMDMFSLDDLQVIPTRGFIVQFRTKIYASRTSNGKRFGQKVKRFGLV